MDFPLRELTRRKFFNFLAGFGAIGVIAMVTYPLLNFLRPPRRSSESASYVEVGTLADIPEGKGRDAIAPDGEPVIIVNLTGEGKLVALSKRCTHLGCIVQLMENELYCPCHGARFNLEGKVITGPAPKPLPKYELKVVGEKIQLGGPLEVV